MVDFPGILSREVTTVNYNIQQQTVTLTEQLEPSGLFLKNREYIEFHESIVWY